MPLHETRQIHVSAGQIFAIYANVAEWPAWDPDLQAAGIDGPFEPGSTGWIKPVGAPRMKTRILSLVPAQSFAAVTRLPLCRMVFTHSLQALPSGADSCVEVTHGVEFHGLLAPLFRRLLGRKISHALPRALRGLQRHAEAQGNPR